MKDPGDTSFVLDISILRDSSQGIIRISQKSYINKVVPVEEESNQPPLTLLCVSDHLLSLVIVVDERAALKALSRPKFPTVGGKSEENYDSLTKFGLHPQLKSLNLCDNSWLRDENIIRFASIFHNLEVLNLDHCKHISKCICQVLRRCCKMRDLKLSNCSIMKPLGINFVVLHLHISLFLLLFLPSLYPQTPPPPSLYSQMLPPPSLYSETLLQPSLYLLTASTETQHPSSWP
ncbi:transmembrane protein, putative [Medicago truncatula]|uniref:Transmembrane protein, putative n=1 Tax=Medicago truncatula TaxID=3880 RepID=G7K629_MEDTR|nr:transmembrane protein, putative [Medicago truncatula]